MANETATPQPTEIASQNATEEQPATGEFHGVIVDNREGYDHIVVIDGAQLLEDSVVNSKTLKHLNLGLFVDVTMISSTREVLPGERSNCADYGYWWYRVRTAEGDEGWVYGNDLLERFDVDAIKGADFPIPGSNAFFLGAARDLSIGASNSDGLTGCDQYYYIFFYREGAAYGQFIESPSESISSFGIEDADGLIRFLYSSEAGDVMIESYEHDEMQRTYPFFNLAQNGQDHTDYSKLIFEYDMQNNRFTVLEIFKRDGEQGTD